VIKDVEPEPEGEADEGAGAAAASAEEVKKSKKEILEEMRDAKYPFMKHAPVVGSYVNSMDVKHNPLGINIRNVKCFRCQQYGNA
jgi:hypothetical protein